MDGVITPAAEDVLPTVPVLNETLADEIVKEKVLTNLTEHPGWRIFVDRLLVRCEQMERLEGLDVTNMTKEQVGEAFLIARSAAARLRDEVGWVDAEAAAIRMETDGA